MSEHTEFRVKWWPLFINVIDLICQTEKPNTNLLVFIQKSREFFGGCTPEEALIRACRVSCYRSYAPRSEKSITSIGTYSAKWPVLKVNEVITPLHSYKHMYLISITTTEADLGYIPDVCVIASLAPYFGLRPRKTPNIDIKCSNCTAVHVVPELQAWALGSWVPWTQQTSLRTRL